jgi:hypothetical protein
MLLFWGWCEMPLISLLFCSRDEGVRRIKYLLAVHPQGPGDLPDSSYYLGGPAEACGVPTQAFVVVLLLCSPAFVNESQNEQGPTKGVLFL